MALFSLTDIKYSKEKRGKSASIGGSEYNIKRFPIDLGNWDKGHYMLFHINTAKHTTFTGAGISGKTTKTEENRYIQSFKTGDSLSSFFTGDKQANMPKEVADRLKGQTSFRINESDYASQTGVLQGNNLFRTTKQSKDAIALYMPDTLNFSYNQQYSDISVTDLSGTLGTAAAAGISIADYVKGNGVDPSKGNLSAFVSKAISALTGRADAAVFAGLTGLASNPQLELIYSSPSFRTFRFSFMFYPRSEQEAKEVQDIIYMFKFHQAPEIQSKSGGRFLVPPSDFDIKFYYNGKENENIPRVSTCVLETVDVDYAPNGFAAYEVPGKTSPSKGETGMPVAIRMDLGFKEVDILTKEFYHANAFQNDVVTGDIKGSADSGTLKSAGQVNDRGEGIY